MTTQTNSTTIYDQRRYRPKGVCDLFDEALDLYKSNFLLLIGATAIFYIPVHALALYFVAPRIQAQALNADAISSPDQVLSYLSQDLLAWIMLSLIYGLLHAVFCAPVVSIAAQRYLNRSIDIGGAYLTAARRAFPLIAAVLIAAIFVIVGLAACVLPGIYLICRWACLPLVVIFEPRMSPFAALSRSYKLTLEFVGRSIGLMLLSGLMTAAVAAAFEGVLYAVLNYIPLDSLPGLALIASNQALADMVGNSFAGLLVFPLSCALLTVFYFDIRIRLEGYDMTILAEHLGLDLNPPKGSLPPAFPPRASRPISRIDRRRPRPHVP